ncbi:MAG: MBOAT family protein [Gammaproteobacteria bacterium]|nr:MBOAT family protein [Gammaproteobacteria bacterium]
MLFNSFEFIFFFLPITLVVYFFLGRRHLHQMAMAWLVAASLFFYGWWNPAYLGLLIGSILFNFAFGAALARHAGRRRGRALLVIGIAANLGVLGYFKYANFFLENVNLLTGAHWQFAAVILPLGISFITFQKIAYLVDAWQGKTREYDFLHFCLFVTFFPQLIAGPIVHHRDVMPQFAQRSLHVFHHENIAVGLSIFIIGLFKKVVIADHLAQFATPIFTAAAGGTTLTFFEAWTGALAYTFQLYFDFSGYSDMAIGLARLFGVKLPLNFHSPYKAESIIDFWRRWHMTLSRFLRDYLYIPLGGNRKGESRRYLNLFLTMLLGGLWHGAAWTFVIWGALHGFYLLVNHAWRLLLEKTGFDTLSTRLAYRVAAWLLTFVAVVVGWVYFRASDAQTALAMVRSMSGLQGVDMTHAFANGFIEHGKALPWVMVAALLAWFAPNTQQLFASQAPALEKVAPARIGWVPSTRWALGVAVLALVSLYHMNRVSEFLYFQF